MTTAVHFPDPIGPGSVSVIDHTHEEAERHAALLYCLALDHQLEVGEVIRLALAMVFHLDPQAALDERWDAEREMRDRIEEVRWDQQRLRELRANGGSFEEVVQILVRNRARVEQLTPIDTVHAAEIKAALAASEERVKRIIGAYRRWQRQPQKIARA